MSNLLKRGRVINKDERIIDYNEVIRTKLQAMMESKNNRMDADGFVSGLNADVVEELVTESGEDAELSPEQIQARAEEANRQAQATIDGANAAAENIISRANDEASRILSNANMQSGVIAEDARARGYDEGMQAAAAELEQHKSMLEADYQEKKRQLEEEYNTRRAELEPELVEVLTEVFRKVTLTVAEDNQEIILHLINGVMRNAETSRDFTIKVSPEDYRFLVSNQGKIYCAISKEINVDIIEDAAMSKNECIIETDSGVFNCGLDIELNNLIKDLKLLSCL